MFLVLRCGQNCSILVWPPQRPCDLHLTKTKIYLPKLPSMLNLKSIRPLGAVVQHRLSKEPDFAIPLSLADGSLVITFVFLITIYNFILLQTLPTNNWWKVLDKTLFRKSIDKDKLQARGSLIKKYSAHMLSNVVII